MFCYSADVMRFGEVLKTFQIKASSELEAGKIAAEVINEWNPDTLMYEDGGKCIRNIRQIARLTDAAYFDNSVLN